MAIDRTDQDNVTQVHAHSSHGHHMHLEDSSDARDNVDIASYLDDDVDDNDTSDHEHAYDLNNSRKDWQSA